MLMVRVIPTLLLKQILLAHNEVTESGLSIVIKRAIALYHDGVSNGLDNDGYNFSLSGGLVSIRAGDSRAGDNSGEY